MEACLPFDAVELSSIGLVKHFSICSNSCDRYCYGNSLEGSLTGVYYFIDFSTFFVTFSGLSPKVVTSLFYTPLTTNSAVWL